MILQKKSKQSPVVNKCAFERLNRSQTRKLIPVPSSSEPAECSDFTWPVSETSYDSEFTRKAAPFLTGKFISSTWRLERTFISVAPSSQIWTAQFSLTLWEHPFRRILCHYTLAWNFKARRRVNLSRCNFDFPTLDPTRKINFSVYVII